MSDSYQAVYDATRSRISGCDTGTAITDAARDAFGGASYLWQHAQQEIYCVSHELQRPAAVYRPKIFIDEGHWCALYGENLQDGVAGFGKSPAEAMDEFDAAWLAKLSPSAEPKP